MQKQNYHQLITEINELKHKSTDIAYDIQKAIKNTSATSTNGSQINKQKLQRYKQKRNRIVQKFTNSNQNRNQTTTTQDIKFKLPLPSPKINIQIITPQEAQNQKYSFNPPQKIAKVDDQDLDLDIPLPAQIHNQKNSFQSLNPNEESFELETKILGDGPPLQAYKNFNRKRLLNSELHYQTQNPLKAVQFWILDILYQDDFEMVSSIKKRFIKGDFEYIEKVFQQEALKQYGGDDINEVTIKKLFIEFVYKIQEQCSIKLIQSYSILEPVIELAVVYYIICSLDADKGQEFLQQYRSQNQNLKSFYQTICYCFGFSLNALNENRYIFTRGDKSITVKAKPEGLLQSWRM